MKKYPPVRILRLGSVFFEGRTLCIDGWEFDVGGRPGTREQLLPEHVAAIGRLILAGAERYGAEVNHEIPVDPVCPETLVESERVTAELLERLRRSSTPEPAPLWRLTGAAIGLALAAVITWRMS
jgi:hypothetical protein